MCICTRLTSAFELVALPTSSINPNNARTDFFFISYSPKSKEDCDCSVRQNTLKLQQAHFGCDFFRSGARDVVGRWEANAGCAQAMSWQSCHAESPYETREYEARGGAQARAKVFWVRRRLSLSCRVDYSSMNSRGARLRLAAWRLVIALACSNQPSPSRGNSSHSQAWERRPPRSQQALRSG